MNEDEKMDIYNKGFKAGAGKEHNTPSQDTLNLINKLETSMAVQDNKFLNMENKIDVIDNNVDEIYNKLDSLIKELDERYASKLTEKIVYILCGMILVAFATQIIALIIK